MKTVEPWGAATGGAADSGSDKVAAKRASEVVDDGDGARAVIAAVVSPAEKEGVEEEGADGRGDIEEEGAGCEVDITAVLDEIGGVESRTVVWGVDSDNVTGPAKGGVESLASTSIGSLSLLETALAEIFLALLGSLGITWSTFRFP